MNNKTKALCDELAEEHVSNRCKLAGTSPTGPRVVAVAFDFASGFNAASNHYEAQLKAAKVREDKLALALEGIVDRITSYQQLSANHKETLIDAERILLTYRAEIAAPEGDE